MDLNGGRKVMSGLLPILLILLFSLFFLVCLSSNSSFGLNILNSSGGCHLQLLLFIKLYIQLHLLIGYGLCGTEISKIMELFMLFKHFLQVLICFYKLELSLLMLLLFLKKFNQNSSKLLIENSNIVMNLDLGSMIYSKFL